ncbi:hypothetical protein [Streptomyces typhae]|nr:hypothetical protein [Streptomyces typhae]
MGEHETGASMFYTPRALVEAVVDLLLDHDHGCSEGDPPAGGMLDLSEAFLVERGFNILGSRDVVTPWAIAESHFRSRLRTAAYGLRTATTTEERREAVREFLCALAELIACLLGFLVRLMMRLLSGLLGRTITVNVTVWTPVPLERTPEITPRGPNLASPVNTHRGGHHRSTLGSVVLAA